MRQGNGRAIPDLEVARMDNGLKGKHEQLVRILQGYGHVAVAFSGGTDSTLLAKVAHDCLGSNMVAITIAGHATPTAVVEDARAWAQAQGIRHVMMPFDELTIPEFAQNVPDRCYHCKKALFTTMAGIAREEGCTCVADGTNVDDEGDYRPGMRALAELGIASPLREAGFTKADVRALSKQLDLPTWNLPSAACLASRFAYGERITRQKLERVERAEDHLHTLGLGQLRVRVHGERGELARIEVEPDVIARLASPHVRDEVVLSLRSVGFTYVSLDLVGFRSGAMNEVL